MKEEDLMVGDWVLYGEKPVQILQLSEGKDYKEIHPIPLTPEILEKNGIKSNDNMFGFQDYELSKDFLLENRGERYCLVKKFPGHRHSTFFIIEVRFIHELQHCLKLCGIDKTIEL